MLPPLAREYLDLGFDAIPLQPNGKRPLLDAWPTLAPVVQWTNAPQGANIGMRGGGEARAAFLDCDDLATWQAATHYLAGLGYYPDGDVPTVATLHDHRHAYVRLAERPPGDFRVLRRTFGKGEFRYGPGAQVVAAGSVIDGREYRLVAGDFRQLPRLDLADLREVVDLDAPSTTPTSTRNASISRLARRLLAGETFTRYPSRSEADAALVAALVNTGHDFASVLTLFTTWQTSGKYAELRTKSEREAIRYLRRTYDRAAQWTQAHESQARARAREAQSWALSCPWPGASGNSDMAVYLAHTEIARQSGAVAYAASVRRLAELAGVAMMTAQRANRRLLDVGYIVYDRAHAGTYSNLYRLGAVQSEYTSSHPYREEVYQSRTSADAFRFRGLGKSALLVLTHLARQPMTEAELEAATGKHRTTVRRALEKMQRLIDPATGEVMALVESDGDAWRIVPAVDLDAVARAVGTAGAGERQKKQHAQDRAGFKRAIARARAGTTPERESDHDA